MSKSTHLHRFNNFNESEIISEEQTTYNYQASNGEYTLTILDGKEEFALQLPEGTTIYHTFTEYENMKILYHQLGRDVTKWIDEVKEKIKEEETQAGVKTGTIIIGELVFIIKVNVNSGECWLFQPNISRRFMVENLYNANMDLPLVLDGALDDHVRSILTKYGLELPDVPYKGELRILGPKETEQNENI